MMKDEDSQSSSSQDSENVPVILFTPPPYMEVLADMQAKRVESLTNFTIKCSEGLEIPVHAILFQMWIPLESMPKNLQRKLQPIQGLNLEQFSVEELAPVILLLYRRITSTLLTEKALLAIEIIKESLKEQLEVEVSPPADINPPPLSPDAKFRCFKILEGVKKEYHFIVASTSFYEICDKCDFSGPEEQLKQHVLQSHDQAEGAGASSKS